VPTGEPNLCYVRLAMKAIDSIEDVLDRLNVIREELLSLERAIERIEASRREPSSEPAPVSTISLKLPYSPASRARVFCGDKPFHIFANVLPCPMKF
jgi:hypothetical protein